MVNGAIFVASGQGVEVKYEKAYSVEPKSAVLIDQLTMHAGALGVGGRFVNFFPFCFFSLYLFFYLFFLTFSLSFSFSLFFFLLLLLLVNYDDFLYCSIVTYGPQEIRKFRKCMFLPKKRRSKVYVFIGLLYPNSILRPKVFVC